MINPAVERLQVVVVVVVEGGIAPSSTPLRILALARFVEKLPVSDSVRIGGMSESRSHELKLKFCERRIVGERVAKFFGTDESGTKRIVEV